MEGSRAIITRLESDTRPDAPALGVGAIRFFDLLATRIQPTESRRTARTWTKKEKFYQRWSTDWLERDIGTSFATLLIRYLGRCSATLSARTQWLAVRRRQLGGYRFANTRSRAGRIAIAFLVRQKRHNELACVSGYICRTIGSFRAGHQSIDRVAMSGSRHHWACSDWHGARHEGDARAARSYLDVGHRPHPSSPMAIQANATRRGRRSSRARETAAGCSLVHGRPAPRGIAGLLLEYLGWPDGAPRTSKMAGPSQVIAERPVRTFSLDYYYPIVCDCGTPIFPHALAAKAPACYAIWVGKWSPAKFTDLCCGHGSATTPAHRRRCSYENGAALSGSWF